MLHYFNSNDMQMCVFDNLDLLIKADKYNEKVKI